MSTATLNALRERDPSSLVSALTSDGRYTSVEEVLQWLRSTNEKLPIHVRRVPFAELEGWQMQPEPLRLAHKSGRFFAIEGIRIATDYGPLRQWDQPVIHQPEIGILGILSKVVDHVRYFLMQCKVEPGNVNGAQLSPTLQATRSNYTRIHGGRKPAYLDYFTGHAPVRVLLDQLQSEQGSRFLGKRNRNMIVEPLEEVPVGEDFHWLTLGQIKNLLHLDNVVNMDARSVLSCIPLPTWEVQMLGSRLTGFGASLVESARSDAPSVHTIREILNWFSWMRSTYERHVVRRGLDSLEEWSVTGDAVQHCTNEHFRVIGVQVQIGNREVERWCQPLLEHPGRGLNGMLTQRFDGVLHFLIRACMYPGSRDSFEFGPTVSRSSYREQFGKPDAPPFLELFRNSDPEHVRLSSVQSEEGGRFFHYQNHYMILELPPGTVTEVGENYIWMTLGQIQELLPHGYFNIEARNLLACLHLL